MFAKAKKVRKDFLRSKTTPWANVWNVRGGCQAGRLYRGEEGNELEWRGPAAVLEMMGGLRGFYAED